MYAGKGKKERRESRVAKARVGQHAARVDVAWSVARVSDFRQHAPTLTLFFSALCTHVLCFSIAGNSFICVQLSRSSQWRAGVF